MTVIEQRKILRRDDTISEMLYPIRYRQRRRAFEDRRKELRFYLPLNDSEIRGSNENKV